MNKTSSEISDKFKPDETGLAIAKSYGLDVDNEIACFIEYWRWSGVKKKDWNVAFRRWSRHRGTICRPIILLNPSELVNIDEEIRRLKVKIKIAVSGLKYCIKSEDLSHAEEVLSILNDMS